MYNDLFSITLWFFCDISVINFGLCISDKVLQFPFVILSTDYDTYAIAYTCQSHKKKHKMHYGKIIQYIYAGYYKMRY